MQAGTMKILVAVKRVIDSSAPVPLRTDGTGIDEAGAKATTNPFDEIALEEALRLKHSGHAREIVAVSIGGTRCQESIRSALAMGADRGLHVATEERLEPLHVAKLLRAVCEREQPALVLMGKQAIDDDCGQTGQMLAALLGWPQGTFASKLTLDDQRLLVQREVDEGVQTLRLQLPAVVTADLRLNEPRSPSFAGTVKAKRMKIESVTPQDLGVTFPVHAEVLRYDRPPAREAGRRVQSVQELVDRLRQEAQVV